jgi:hypothetical protein
VKALVAYEALHTAALYVAKLVGDPTLVALANSKHPLVPLTTLRAGFRLKC